jgi:hypothetical protein
MNWYDQVYATDVMATDQSTALSSAGVTGPSSPVTITQPTAGGNGPALSLVGVLALLIVIRVLVDRGVSPAS